MSQDSGDNTQVIDDGDSADGDDVVDQSGTSLGSLGLQFFKSFASAAYSDSSNGAS